MDFNKLTENYVVIVVLACLIIGYIIKTSFSFVKNDYIPTILAVIGSIVNGMISGWSIESVIYGALMGLSSTGLHQVFKDFIEGKREDGEE